MPRPKSGPHLWYDKSRSKYSIIDGRKVIRTGCGKSELRSAEDALQDYLASRHVIKPSADPLIADVLKAYSDEHLIHKVSAPSVARDMVNLERWWGDKTVREITADNCRIYIAWRNAPTICRRELGFLMAAVMHWHREHGPLGCMPAVVKPDKTDSRTRWMTRTEAAQFLLAIRKLGRRQRRRLFRFFIIGWYTGTRHTAICRISWSMVDLESRILYRRPTGEAETKKRRPPCKMGARLTAHMRRWRRLDGPNGKYVIEHGGRPCTSLDNAWHAARKLAGLPDVMPHTLRHSRATHLMRQGVDYWQAAQSLGMSVEMLRRVYGHHRPDWQSEAAEAK